MSNKIFSDDCIVLDGRLDEAVWNEVPEGTGFTTIKTAGGEGVEGQKTGGVLVDDQTFVKILPCENRVYFGIKCMERNIPFAKTFAAKSVYTGNSVEIFLSPSNSTSEMYNFVLTVDGLTQAIYFVEGGNNREVYKPNWNHAVYFGEDYWSVEIEIPYTAMYYTPNATWSDKWHINVVRNQPIDKKINNGYAEKQVFVCSTWSETDNFLKAENFQHYSGMPIRPIKNDVKFNGVALNLNEVTDHGYCGEIEVLLNCATAGTYEFKSDFSEPVTVTLQPGANVVTAPCCVQDLIRYNITMEFTRVDDGELFKYGSTITAECEPIRIAFTLPEYRTNFYPGQDSSKIVGKVYAAKPVTLTLEGGGMETKTVTPDAEGNFTIETPDFQKGTEAILTATIDGWEIKKTIRNIVPNGHTMAWISDGKLVIDGKPVLRRNVFAPNFLIGEAFGRKYYNDNLYETEITKQYCFTQPRWMIRGAETPPSGEATKDQMPSDEMLKKVDAHLEENKDRDYVFHYIYDEPEYKKDSLIYMRNFYEYLAEKDPYHPALIATHNPDRYLPYCDWVEPDPYLGVRVGPEIGRMYSQPLNTLHEFIDPVVQMERPDKCMGFILTAFAFKVASAQADYPTFDEFLCNNWVVVNHGAKTIWSYAGHDLNDRAQLYEGTRFIFSSLAALEDVILNANFKPLLCTEDIDAYLYEYGEDTVFVAVNMSNKPQTATLDGIDGTWYHFRHNDMLTGNTFEMKPFEVVIGTRKKKDDGLPTYEETAALIDGLEAQRASNKSLLFERERDIVITLTDKYDSNWVKYKLFDGVRDNFACILRGDTYLELNVTKIMPTFNKVVICGYCVEGAVVKARIDGELKELKPREVQNEEFSTTLLLDEPVCTDLLHFEFPAERVELYEIELY